MSVLLLIPASFGIALTLVLLSYIVGRVLPERFMLAGPAKWLQSVIAGFSILVCVMRLPYRDEYPESLGFGLVFLLAVIGLTMILRTTRPAQMVQTFRGWCSRQTPDSALNYALIFLPGLMIAFAPLVLSHALIWQNYGPDYDGDLMSASYLADHHKFSDLMREFVDSAHTNEWWFFKNTGYTHPDFRTLVGVEFFIRSLRFGHAVLSILLMHLFHAPLWLAFFCLSIYAFIATPLVIAEAGSRRGISPHLAALAVALVVGSQNYILLMYEGINVQFMEMPILIFVVLNWRAVFIEQKTLWQKMLLALIFSGMISTFGEGIQILGIFAVICISIVYLIGRANHVSIKPIMIDALQIAGLTTLIDPTFVFDFILWVYGRAQEGFIGGALPGNWSAFSVLFSIPSYLMYNDRPFRLMVHANYVVRLIEVCTLIGLGTHLWRKRHSQIGIDIAVAMGTLLIFCLVGNTYVLWKVAIIMQPLMILGVLSLLPERSMKLSTKNWLRMYVALVVAFSAYEIHRYHVLALPMHPGQFAVDRHLTNGQSVAIVTPSMNRVYLRLADTGEDLFVNGGWRRDNLEPDFSIGGRQDMPVALYFDCDAEGHSRCAAIKAKLGASVPERTLVPLDGVTVRGLLYPSGGMDRTKLNPFVLDHYGVEARGGENSRD